LELSGWNNRQDLASTGENHGQRDGAMRVSENMVFAFAQALNQ